MCKSNKEDIFLIRSLFCSVLCGKGAKKFAKERNLEVVGSQELISEDMFRQHCKYTKAYTKELKKFQENSKPPTKKPRVDHENIFKPNDSNVIKKNLNSLRSIDKYIFS